MYIYSRTWSMSWITLEAVDNTQVGRPGSSTLKGPTHCSDTLVETDTIGKLLVFLHHGCLA